MSIAPEQDAIPPALAALVPIVEVNAHAIVLLTLEGLIVGWSPGARELWGWEQDEVCHQPVQMLSPSGRDGPGSDEVVRRLTERPESMLLHTKGLNREGHELDLSLSMTPVTTGQGKLEGLCGIAVENSMLAAEPGPVKGSERLFRLLAENAQDVVYRLRLQPDLAFEYVSSSATTVTGFTPEDHFADPELPLRRLHPDDVEAITRNRVAPEAIQGPTKFRFRHRDGHWVWLEETATPVVDDEGRAIAMEGIVRDVTARQEATIALKVALDRERQALQELVELDQRRRRFINALSHELRTPLTTVLGFATTIVKHLDELTTEQLRLFTQKVVSNAERLEQVIEDVMALIDGREGVREVVDLARLVRAEVEARSWPERTVQLSTSTALIEGDAAQMRRMIRALLDNLECHTAHDVGVGIEVATVQQEVRLVVEDDGDGWCDSVREIALEPFTWGDDSAGSASPGLGIGLALVANLARRHGGRALACDALTGGARVEVHLPRSTAD